MENWMMCSGFQKEVCILGCSLSFLLSVKKLLQFGLDSNDEEKNIKQLKRWHFTIKIIP